jgi:hypothetical protein
MTDPDAPKRKVGRAMRTIQVVLVVMAVGLLAIHTFANQWTIDGKPLTVDGVSLGLVAVAAGALLLARVEKIKWGNAEIALRGEIAEAKKALEALPVSKTVPAQLDPAELQAVVDDPAAVVKATLQDIRNNLQDAAKRAGLDRGQKLTPAEATRRLADASKFDAAQANAVRSVIRAAQTASMAEVTAAEAGELRRFANLVVELANGVTA